MPTAAERALGLVVAVTCVATGGALLAGLIRPAAPDSLRFGCGVILVLLGIKRYVVTRAQSSRPRRRRFDDESDS